MCVNRCSRVCTCGYNLFYSLYIWTCSCPLWRFLLPLLDFFSPSAGSCSFTGGWDNNVKYLKAKLGVQEDKNPGSQALTNNTSAASVCGHFYLLTHHRGKPRRRLRLLRTQNQLACTSDRPGLTPCPFPSLPRWCSLARRRWLRLSCCHPRRSCKLLQMLRCPTTGQCPKRLSKTNDQVTSC